MPGKMSYIMITRHPSPSNTTFRSLLRFLHHVVWFWLKKLSCWVYYFIFFLLIMDSTTYHCRLLHHRIDRFKRCRLNVAKFDNLLLFNLVPLIFYGFCWKSYFFLFIISFIHNFFWHSCSNSWGRALRGDWWKNFQRLLFINMNKLIFLFISNSSYLMYTINNFIN
jgi:hypothetical protein